PPGFGQAAPMSGGYHDFFMATWNGNQLFNASLIGPANESYAPLYAGPVPAQPTSANSLAEFPGLDILEDAWHYVSGAAKYVWDSATGAVKVVGSVTIKGIRALGSVAGKIMAWAVCELGSGSYTATGIRYVENHSQQANLGIP